MYSRPLIGAAVDLKQITNSSAPIPKSLRLAALSSSARNVLTSIPNGMR